MDDGQEDGSFVEMGNQCKSYIVLFIMLVKSNNSLYSGFNSRDFITIF